MLLLSPCRALVNQKPELANYSHFARLFKSQLLQVEFVNPFLPSPHFHYVFLPSFELSLIPCIPFLALHLLSSWSALPLVSTFKPSWPLSCCSFLIVLCILLGLLFLFLSSLYSFLALLSGSIPPNLLFIIFLFLSLIFPFFIPSLLFMFFLSSSSSLLCPRLPSPQILLCFSLFFFLSLYKHRRKFLPSYGTKCYCRCVKKKGLEVTSVTQVCWVIYKNQTRKNFKGIT